MDPADEPAIGRAPGTILAAERERQGLSRVDIAQRLHMSASLGVALEAGDYTRLPRGTFLRGFVRNYARLLGQDATPLLASLADDAPHHSRPGLVVASQNIRFDPLGQRLSNPYVKAAGIATVVVAVAFATMYWWLFVRPAPPAALAVKKAVIAEAPRVEPLPLPVEAPRMEARPVELPKKADPPRPDPAKAGAKTVPPAAVVAAASATAATSQPADAAVVAAGGSVIRLKFRGSAWVEIKDGRGKVLLSRNNPGGSEAEVIGKGPFSVVVGNAPEVTMFLNDREFDLEPHTRVAVARFTVR